MRYEHDDKRQPPRAGWDDTRRDESERGFIERGVDEVRSWFGDDEAFRRRILDDQRDRMRSNGPEAEAAWEGGGELNAIRDRNHGPFAGRGPKNYGRSNERIREDVVDHLSNDPRVDASDVEVEVQDGEVTLSGHVLDRRMRRAAEECVEPLRGVRDVHNHLTVGPGGNRSFADMAPGPLS